MSGDGYGMSEARTVWDAEASTFDNEPDHGLQDSQVRAAWASLMVETLGTAPLRIADLGCGTGSLSLLLHDLGHQVTGLDVSPRMLDKARQKAGAAVTFVEGDAAQPDLPSRAFDAVLCRHVLWALPDARAALTCWTRLLVPGGIICLVEGVWHTGVGVSADQIRAALPSNLRCTDARSLSGETALWGASVSDERFVMTARLA
jgi:SAM-dependent methyltransferase